MSADASLAAKDSALQHADGCTAKRVAPRPLPLFLDMVARVAQRDPLLARRALLGLDVYADAPRLRRPLRPIIHAAGRAKLLDGGGSGPPVVLVPSLINSSAVLDIDSERSLLENLSINGFRAMLVDWGTPTREERNRSIADHVSDLLAPLVSALGEPVHVVGYCLGGTMAIALAAMMPLRSLTLLATPWHFGRYPGSAQDGLAQIWRSNQVHVAAMGVAPVELLQTAFWSLDPDRTVSKFAKLAERSPTDPDIIAFAAVEDWTNSGAPLTYGAAHDLFVHLIGDDAPGIGRWVIGSRPIDPARLRCPTLHFTASNDRIAPAATAPDGIRTVTCPSGHVGMIVGHRAESGCRQPLREWLAQH